MSATPPPPGLMRGRIGAEGAMVAGVFAWLWPVGLGGSMPVGGDVTQFSIGLMAFLRSSLRAGRLPLWNDLWGFGFPGLAESQMGVYYPPHWPLYGLLPTEVAFAASLVLHTLWAAFGASWACRRFGASAGAGALGGFAFATSGMFLIHQSHHWAYTVGSWMPWAWGLAWQVARGEGGRRAPWALAAVLAIQVLPGHFQWAFATEVGAIGLALAGGRRPIRAAGAVGLAIAGAMALAAAQLGPTLALASAAKGDRTYEYLSSYATTPAHLISYVAPGFFHRSPLWRSLAWDPFRTAPEENLAYIGLVPLWLALVAIRRGWRGDPAARALAIAALAATLLSLGPWVPGFGLLIRLPGFSFFRAPARWGLAAGLALSILAALGFDRLRAGSTGGRSLFRFAIGAALATALMLGAIELGLASARPGPSGWFDRAAKDLAFWDGRASRSLLGRAFRPQDDPVVRTTTARLEGRPRPAPGTTLDADRPAIYRRELTGTAALLAALATLGALGGRRRGLLVAGAVAVAGIDPLLPARYRHFDYGPVRPLIDQSPTLAVVSGWPRGVRTLDPARNLFLVAGANSAEAYRTLDLPAPSDLLARAREPARDDATAAEALRALGIGARVLDPFESPAAEAFLAPGWRVADRLDDPALATWLYGEDFSRAEHRTAFAILRPDPGAQPARAWLVRSFPPGADPGPDAAMSRADVVLATLRGARPLPARSDRPERDEVDVDVDAGPISPGAPGPAVVLSRTYDPEWRATWIGADGAARPAAPVGRALGGWQSIRVPGPGRWTLRLDYEGRAAWRGLAVSAVAWIGWTFGWARAGRRRSAAIIGEGGGGEVRS